MHEPDELSIGAVKHKTFIEINEEGTEAAGVTSVEMERTSIEDNKEVFMQINHPFVLVIRERNSNAILFIGKIINPS
jgi:serpin B